MGFWRNRTIRGQLYQAVALLLVVGCILILADNTLENMRVRGIQSGFGFLQQPAGFDISESLFGYDSTQPYWKAFLTGVGNTLKVALLGIVLTTLLGVLLGVGRFSHNILVRSLCLAYVETFRNVPLLLQLLMWYLVCVQLLPDVVDAEPFLGFYLSKAGLALPVPVWGQGLHWDVPVKAGFGIDGGVTLSPEFLALLLGLTLYTASYVAEIVRSGIASVPRGQREAALALGLSRSQSMRLVQLPQALRVIIPPMTNQYLNLTKNSSLAVAVGYPDLVSVANTSINQTGRAVECIAVIMAVYLALSLLTSAFMGWYNRRVAIRER
ncbi:ABC transporter permease subunit [Candidatus Thiothrix sp. Deng01]|uniref:ABC transporter permease subunit n=1 Tax=Candidatus Thiothrix phosphatis TaxID=3112415 RepID=A0ABU6CZD9_9GAMM|nr:ABC transporter permease subunit [Candidatus Thiothrix sp. Deng01]MEB4591758.1 ABC transporter permease subunit [Candidatus Thiothrix sp. Deng01]